MKYFEKNKYTIVVIMGIVIVSVIALICYNLFFADNGVSYGNRLDDIKNYVIEEETYTKVKNELEKNEKVSGVSTSLQGKIVYVMFNVSKGTSLKDAKSIANKVLEYFSKEQLSYYDIQVIVSCDDKENKSYPIIGYKSAKGKSLTFTKDR